VPFPAAETASMGSMLGDRLYAPQKKMSSLPELALPSPQGSCLLLWQHPLLWSQTLSLTRKHVAGPQPGACFEAEQALRTHALNWKL
jgi:hypothetical protein